MRDTLGCWDLSNPKEAESFQDNIQYVRNRFEKKEIKWYCVLDETFDPYTGEVSSVLVENHYHEEIPPVEFNIKAKGFVPPPQTLQFKPAQLPTWLADMPTEWVTGDPEPDNAF